MVHQVQVMVVRSYHPAKLTNLIELVLVLLADMLI